MKYFSPSYWFKLWVLSAPLFSDKTQGINAMSIDNKNIKDWTSNNTNLQSINQDNSFTNSSTNYPPYNLSHQVTNQTIDPFYQSYLDLMSNQELETSIHKHHHEKSRNRHKRAILDYENNNIYFYNTNNDNNVYYYLIKDNNFEKEIFIFKVDGINEEIKEIKFFLPNEIYFLSTTGNVYYLNSGSNTAVRIDEYYNNSRIRNIKKILKWSKELFYFLTKKGEVFYWYKNSNKIYKIDGINEEIKDAFIINNNGIYFLSTTGNVYCVSYNRWVAYKIQGINEEIKDAFIINNNEIYFLSQSGYVYYLASNWWTAVRFDTYYNDSRIRNVKSIMFIPTSTAVTYFNTDHGIFTFSEIVLRKTVTKIDGINEEIKEIKVCFQIIQTFPLPITFINSYFLSTTGNAYYLNNGWNAAVRVDTYYNNSDLKKILSINFLNSIFDCNYAYFTTVNGFYSLLKNKKLDKIEDGIKLNPYYSYSFKNILQVNGDFYDISNIKNWKKMKNKMGTKNIINNESKHFFLLENKKFNDLKKHFSDWNSTETINLGLINDNTDSDIKNAIKQKYPNLKMSDIEFIKKYSHFNQDYKSNFTKVLQDFPQLSKYVNTPTFGGFETKLNIKNSNIDYPSGLLKPKFSYVTQTKLNETSNIIANDEKVKIWIEHINEWNSTLWQAINNAKTFTPEHLYNWKRSEKETLKAYIRDWSYVSTLIEHELKLDELDKNVQGLKENFDEIKNQINELNNKIKNLDKRVIDLETALNWDCGNSGWLASSISGGVSTGVEVLQKSAVIAKKIEKIKPIVNAIPVLGNIVSAISGLTAAICGIAGV